MRVEFTAFADDSIYNGNLDLQADRLSDVIADDAGFQIRDVVMVALDDGRTVSVSAVTISRIDFDAISASGPRGNSSRRIPTRAHPVRTRLGPYEVLGYLHAPPSAHVFSGVVRRRVVPLTSARIRYRLGAHEIEQSFDALLLNGDRVTWVEPANNRDFATGRVLDVPARYGRPKDMTGSF
jgi:hypothetical protein